MLIIWREFWSPKPPVTCVIIWWNIAIASWDMFPNRWSWSCGSCGIGGSGSWKGNCWRNDGIFFWFPKFADFPTIEQHAQWQKIPKVLSELELSMNFPVLGFVKAGLWRNLVMNSLPTKFEFWEKSESPNWSIRGQRDKAIKMVLLIHLKCLWEYIFISLSISFSFHNDWDDVCWELPSSWILFEKLSFFLTI